jgi:hypothetical protein
VPTPRIITLNKPLYAMHGRIDRELHSATATETTQDTASSTEAAGGGTDNGLDELRLVFGVEAGDDFLIESPGFGDSPRAGKKVRGGFPGLDDFPVVFRPPVSDGRVEFDGVIEATLGGPDISETALGLRAPVRLVGISAEQLRVTGGGTRKKRIAFGALRLGGREVRLLNGLVEEFFGGSAVLLGLCGASGKKQRHHYQ